MKKTGIYITGIVFYVLLISTAPRGPLYNRDKFPKLFDAITYDSVVAYDFTGTGDNSIVKYGSLNSRLVLKRAALTKSQIDSLNATMGDHSTFGGSTFACFEPRLGFVYYRKGLIVAHISVCLTCNFLQSSPEIPIAVFKNPDPESLPYYLYGFSEAGIKRFSDLCAALGFSHCKGRG